MSWLRSVERLSRSVPSQVTDARIQVRQLALAARAVAPLHEASCTPGTDCATACPLADEPNGPSLCQLARRLADLEPNAAATTGGGAQAVSRWREELAGAVDLVRTCRQTAHPTGTCWLAYPDGRDGCGEVLRLAHHTTTTRKG